MSGWMYGFRCEKILDEYTHRKFPGSNMLIIPNTNSTEYMVVDKNITRKSDQHSIFLVYYKIEK
jgi:hypothetical protein